jgi:TetR/AcrR family transcriptional regulator, cholesterol catabolism regulator
MSEPTPIDRLARRQETRRRLILDAAATEFAESGYERATLDRIGDRVGLSKASLYHYVSGKEDLLAQLIERVINDIESRAATRTPDGADPVERLTAFIHAHLETATATPEGRLLAHHLEAFRIDATTELAQRHEATLASVIDDGVAAGLFPPIPVRAVVKLIFGAINSVPVWFDPGGDLGLDDITAMVVRLVLRGLQGTEPPTRSSKKPSRAHADQW